VPLGLMGSLGPRMCSVDRGAECPMEMGNFRGGFGFQIRIQIYRAL